MLNNEEKVLAKTYHESHVVLGAVLLLYFWLGGSQFTVKIVLKTLKWLLIVSDEYGSFERWKLQLSEFELDIVHCPDNKQEATEAISSMPTSGTGKVKQNEGIPL